MNVLHFGLGAFHRAHQAVYTEAAGESIIAVAPRSRAVVEALREQNYRFSVSSLHSDSRDVQVISSITAALHAESDASEVIARLADPDTTVMTLTITEKGYQALPETLITGLLTRFRTGGAPISIVSCDNLADNGDVLRTAVRARISDSDVLAWLDEAVAFPATVVDRIVPSTTEFDQQAAASALGWTDRAAVIGEPYSQWVLQDSFATDRPKWERGGAEFVPDVTAHQITKLRLLNGSHSALAYLGLAAGVSTVAEAMTTDWATNFVRGYAAQIAPTLPAGGPDPSDYAENLIMRFTNPAIRHALSQIGSDGSLKIRQRWFPALREIDSVPYLALALAAWVHATRPENITELTDPLADALVACWTSEAPPVAALLRVVGAPDLADRADLIAAVAAHLPALEAGRIIL